MLLNILLTDVKDFHRTQWRGFMQMAKNGLPGLVKCYPETFAPIKSWLPLLRRRHKWIVTECLRPPLTLTHGDAHIENAFFDQRFDGGGRGGELQLDQAGDDGHDDGGGV